MFSKVNVDTSELKALVPKFGRFRAGIVPLAAGVLTKQMRVLSQQQQKSFAGSEFVKLTKPYRKFKEHKGHPGIPNLTFSGKYMNRGFGLHTDGKIPFIGPNSGFEGQAEGLEKKRPHYGVHPDSDRLTSQGLESMFNSIVNANA